MRQQLIQKGVVLAQHTKKNSVDLIQQVNGPVSICMQATDEHVKTFTFFFQIKQTQVQSVTLDHVQKATNSIKRVQSLFDIISRNIYIKNDIDKQLTQQSIESKHTHKWLSIVKMVLTVVMCAGQAYFVTLFFTTGQKKKSGQSSSSV